MKKLIVGAVVGGLILFIWQFLSWGILDLHGSQMDYTANQDSVLAVLELNLEEGEYFVPRAPRSASTEEAQALMNDRIGKPWATISYHSSMSNNMGMNMTRGIIADIAAILLLTWILLKFSNLDLKTAVLSSVAIGLIGYLSINYLNSIWFQGNSMPDLIDALVPWSLIGCWLGWWLNR